MKLVITKKLMKLAKLVWDDRNNGRHAWRKYYSNFITIESESDDEGDFLVVTLTNKVDSLGYAYGKVLDFAILSREDFGG